MDLLRDFVSGVAIAITTAAILAFFAVLWRRWVIRKYQLSKASKQVLASLWDEGLIRIPSGIAKELAPLWDEDLIRTLSGMAEELAPLGDEDVIRTTSEMAEELAPPGDEDVIRTTSEMTKKLARARVARVIDLLSELKKHGLVTIRKKKKGEFWKITLKGKEYLSQLLWLGDVI